MAEETIERTKQQHPVPQNIMSVEFKLIGDLTLRQFFYLAGGILIAFLINRTGLPFFFKYPIAGVFLLMGIGMAFFPIQDRGLDQWIRNFLTSVFSPQQRIWRKNPFPPSYFLSDYAKVIRNEIVALSPSSARRQISEYLNLRKDEDSDPLLSKEKEFLRQLRDNVSDISEMPLYEFPEDYDVHKTIRLGAVSGEGEPEEIVLPPKKPSLPAENVPMPKAGRVRRGEDDKQGKIDLEDQLRELKKLMDEVKGRYESVYEKQQEKDISISDTIDLRQANKDINKQLKDISLQTEDISGMDVDDELKRELEEFRKQIKDLKGKNTSLETELNKQKEIVKLSSELKEKNKDFQKRIEELEEEKLRLQKEIFEGEKLEGKKTEPAPPPADVPQKEEKITEPPEKPKLTIEKEEPPIRVEKSAPPPKKEPPPPSPQPQRPTEREMYQAKLKLTNSPNIINGVVKGQDDKFVNEAVVIVKDFNNHPVRALKTNELGQFIISTPVPEGEYSIEVVKKGYIFDIISVSVNGEILSPVLIRGRNV